MLVFWGSTVGTFLVVMSAQSAVVWPSAEDLSPLPAGLCTISLSGQMVIQNVLGMHIQEIIKNIITLNKTKRLLSNTDWDLVEKIKIKHSIPVSRHLATQPAYTGLC